MCLPKSFVIFDVPATVSQQSQLYQTLSTEEISGGKCTSDNNSKMYGTRISKRIKGLTMDTIGGTGKQAPLLTFCEEGSLKIDTRLQNPRG